ncbi:MAG TPA: peptidylprolyl isomerase [Luteibaculaceae bacterium]|nr:peptidylprolyl isomerase [Luteibaculaceae bacterium]
MTINQNKVVTLSYQLTVDGNLVDQSPAGQPLLFLYGAGQMIPGFERQLEGLKVGDNYQFTVQPEEGYGFSIPEDVVEIPMETFIVDGNPIPELVLGGVIHMQDNHGNRLRGEVREIKENTVTMDFNHPLADKTLAFTGEIIAIREADADELAHGHVHGEGGHHH